MHDSERSVCVSYAFLMGCPKDVAFVMPGQRSMLYADPAIDSASLGSAVIN